MNIPQNWHVGRERKWVNLGPMATPAEFWARPIFQVADVDASLTYYGDVLGFSVAWTHGDSPMIVAQVERGGIDIILDARSAMPRPSGTSVLTFSLHRPENLDELFQRFRERGAKVVAEPFPVVWQEGVRQFDVADLDGNLLLFWG
jgi:uncharacterized glyoxalase superfamily protein PhnB